MVLSPSWGKRYGTDQVSLECLARSPGKNTCPERFYLAENRLACGQCVGNASPEGRVGERVWGQVAGVIVGCSSGGVQAKRRQGGHAQVLSSVVGPEASQVVLSHRAGGHHVVHRPLEAMGEEAGEQR